MLDAPGAPVPAQYGSEWMETNDATIVSPRRAFGTDGDAFLLYGPGLAALMCPASTPGRGDELVAAVDGLFAERPAEVAEVAAGAASPAVVRAHPEATAEHPGVRR